MVGPILFGCVEQMHVCVEQMHIISNYIYIYMYIYMMMMMMMMMMMEMDGLDGYWMEHMLV